MFGQLKELEAGAPGFLKDLIRQFLEQAVQQLALVRDFIRSRDGEGLHRAAHLLKGSAGSLGALPLMELLRSLEAAGGKRAWTEAEALLPRIEGEFIRVRTALEAV
jgi:HPt (histidine-containing phosphotransfer) domain-containing protein